MWVKWLPSSIAFDTILLLPLLPHGWLTCMLTSSLPSTVDDRHFKQSGCIQKNRPTTTDSNTLQRGLRRWVQKFFQLWGLALHHFLQDLQDSVYVCRTKCQKQSLNMINLSYLSIWKIFHVILISLKYWAQAWPEVAAAGSQLLPGIAALAHITRLYISRSPFGTLARRSATCFLPANTRSKHWVRK